MANPIVKIIGNCLNAISYISPKFASEKALYLFATPRKGRLTEPQKIFLDSAEKLNLKHNEFNIATYQWKGTNKTILLAHGWESNTQRWEVLINKLKALNYNIVALDAPAHGASSGKQFNAILYSECINVTAKHYNPEIIIGHSVGGMSTVFYQHTYKNKNLQKVVLLGAPAEFTSIFKRYITMMGFNKRIEDGLNAIVVERFKQEPAHFSLANFVKTIDTKTLIIHDIEDTIIPFKDGKAIARNHKNGTFIHTKGFGHGLRNTIVYNHILEFIKS